MIRRLMCTALFFPAVVEAAECQGPDGKWYPYSDPICSRGVRSPIPSTAPSSAGTSESRPEQYSPEDDPWSVMNQFKRTEAAKAEEEAKRKAAQAQRRAAEEAEQNKAAQRAQEERVRLAAEQQQRARDEALRLQREQLQEQRRLEALQIEQLREQRETQRLLREAIRK